MDHSTVSNPGNLLPSTISQVVKTPNMRLLAGELFMQTTGSNSATLKAIFLHTQTLWMLHSIFPRWFWVIVKFQTISLRFPSPIYYCLFTNEGVDIHWNSSPPLSVNLRRAFYCTLNVCIERKSHIDCPQQGINSRPAVNHSQELNYDQTVLSQSFLHTTLSYQPSLHNF